MNSPLTGKRIAVTRPAHQSGSMCRMLQDRGATIVEFPTIRIEPVSNPKPLQRALRKLDTFDRVLFTSVNAVTHTWQFLTFPWPDTVRVAAIGPATAAALTSRGVKLDFIPSEYVAEALATGLGPIHGESILLPRASKVRPALVELLCAGGANVTSVTAYETHVNHPPDAAYAALAIGADAITFTSGSTVDGFVAVTPDPRPPLTAACIGPVTAQVAAEAGFHVTIVAKTYTTEGLITALEEYFEEFVQT